MRYNRTLPFAFKCGKCSAKKSVFRILAALTFSSNEKSRSCVRLSITRTFSIFTLLFRGYDEFTYAEFRRHIFCLTENWTDQDWNGRNVLLAGDSGYGWVVSFFAILCKGGTAVVADCRLNKESAEKLIAVAKCTSAVVDKETFDRWELGAADLPVSEFLNEYRTYSELEYSFHGCKGGYGHAIAVA